MDPKQMEETEREFQKDEFQEKELKEAAKAIEKELDKELDKKVSRREVALEWLKDILIALVIAVVVLQFIKPTVVKQRSMEPNFHTDDYLFVSRQSYKLLGGDPARGDVIVFRSDLTTDDGHSKLLIKRVIGLPGETISISGGEVYIDGQAIDDSFTMEQYTGGTMAEMVVPENAVFCMGDNREVSIDSRSDSVGCVPYEAIMGKVVFRLYPFSQFGVIRNPFKE